MSDYDWAVERLVQQYRIPRAHAEEIVRRDAPHLAPAKIELDKDARVLEKAEQVEIRKTAIAYGFRVYVLSQPRATKQSPGLADLWLAHQRQPIAFWWESKRQVGGVFSTAQQEFREDCVRTNTGYGSGDRHAFAEKLVKLGLAVLGRGPLGIIPIKDRLPEASPT